MVKRDWLNEVRHRLREYADWLVRNEARLSGWPVGRTSPAASPFEGGPSTKELKTLQYTKIPARIRTIHREFVTMPDSYTWALWVKYLAPRKLPGQVGELGERTLAELHAQAKGISVSELRRRIDLAEHYLAGAIKG